ncbi:S-layer family protein [Paenibacillus taihuensis]|uniref:S-layer family protein n=1 Tax=Paenibacillus taihuensis TaxID=1156355 RepID=A0A3D9RV20_9BACL|nr:S-layer homology domain-containing protein [Paenibacillus taihuensis]REE83839.1 S-layer family protein [Paenibacillus taihuensis]
MSRKTRKTSQVISSIAIGSMLFTGTAAFASPSVVNENVSTHWATKELQKWLSIGLLKGDANGNLNPNDAITRAEFVTILNRVFNLQSTTNSKTFADANPSDWYFGELQKASAAGLLNGDSKNNANPRAAITRQEAAALISRGFQVVSGTNNTNFSDSSQIAKWASEAVSTLASKGYLNGRGNGNFNPLAKITRAESFVMTDRVMGTLVRTPEDLANLPSTITGNVTIALPGATLKGLTINGDVYVTDAAAADPVVLDHTTVTGDLSIVVAQGVNLIASSITGTTNVADARHTISLNLDSDSSLNTLVLNAPANVTGTGSILTANINSTGVTVAQQPTTVKVAAGITSTVAGKSVDNTTSTGTDTGNNHGNDTGNNTGGNNSGDTGNINHNTPVVSAVSNGSKVNMYSTQITRLQPEGLDITQPIKWTTSDPYIAYVDTIGNSAGNFAGKVLGVSDGTATITGKQGETTVTVSVTVTNDPKIATNLEKIVYYYSAGDDKIPDSSDAPALNTDNFTALVGRTWPSASYAGYLNGPNGVKWMLSSDHASVTLYDPNKANPADQIQYLQGGRYIPQDASGTTQSIDIMMTDAAGGLWIIDAAGNATHIVRKQISVMALSLQQVEYSRNFLDRTGFQDGKNKFSSQADKIASLMGTKDTTDVSVANLESDNSGTWTSLFGMGELGRYNYMKSVYGSSDQRTIDAKSSAIRATEAVTLLAYISGTQLTVPAKDNVNDSDVLAFLGADIDGKDEGKPVYIDSNGQYTLNPIGTTPAPGDVFVRDYLVNPANPMAIGDTNRWVHKNAGTTTDINGTTVSYSSLIKNTGDLANLKSYNTLPVPTRLAKLYDPNAGTANAIPDNQIYYKPDASSDEFVQDFAFLNMAYDTFKTDDKELASLIKTAIISSVNATIINNYYHMALSPRVGIDPAYKPTGPKYSAGYVNSGNGLNVPTTPTRWGNFNPEYLDGANNVYNKSDYEDGPLNAGIALQMLQLGMKIASDTSVPAYAAEGIVCPPAFDYAQEFSVMTTPSLYEARYPKTYNSTSLLDMMEQYHSRYFGISEHNGNDIGAAGSSFESYLNYSDEEEVASLFFGIATSLPANVSNEVLNSYHRTLNQWWYNEKRSKNPFLSYYYAVALQQLANRGVDITKDAVDTNAAAWALTRMPSNLGVWDVSNSTRNDVTDVLDYGLLLKKPMQTDDFRVDQLLPRDEFPTFKYNGTWFEPEGDNALSVEASTILSMPYWFALDPSNNSSIARLGSKATPPNLPVPSISAVGSTDVTIHVGETVDLDVTGSENSYISNISWATTAWDNQDDDGYVANQVVDLRTRYNLSTNGRYYGSQVTGLNIGTTTVIAMTTDAGSDAPRTVTFNITVVDPNTSATPVQDLAQVTPANFALPSWLTSVLSNANLGTNGNAYASIEYSSSDETKGTVNPETGMIVYNTEGQFNVIATVTYSDMTVNGSPMFEKSHVMTFVCPVVKAAN